MIHVGYTNIDGLLLIKPDVFKDARGTYTELYDTELYKDVLPIGTIFVQDDYSHSKKNVLRGIHGDEYTSKLISVLNGEIYSVIVDNRPNSKTYMKWESFYITRKNNYQIFIPAGCGSAMLALTDDVVFHYKQTTHYIPNSQFTIRWNDERLNIKWPVKEKNIIISKRDLLGKYEK